MKIKLLFVLSFFFIASNTMAQQTKKIDTLWFTGKVIKHWDTGLGPQIGAVLVSKTHDTLTIYQDYGGNVEITDDKTISVSYYMEPTWLAIGIRKTSEPENMRFSSDTPNRLLEKKQFYFEGVYKWGEQGDMGKYCSIQLSDGKTMDFTGTFEVDLDDEETYQNQEVEITCIEDEVFVLVSIAEVK